MNKTSKCLLLALSFLGSMNANAISSFALGNVPPYGVTAVIDDSQFDPSSLDKWYRYVLDEYGEEAQISDTTSSKNYSESSSGSETDSEQKNSVPPALLYSQSKSKSTVKVTETESVSKNVTIISDMQKEQSKSENSLKASKLSNNSSVSSDNKDSESGENQKDLSNSESNLKTVKSSNSSVSSENIIFESGAKQENSSNPESNLKSVKSSSNSSVSSENVTLKSTAKRNEIESDENVSNDEKLSIKSTPTELLTTKTKDVETITEVQNTDIKHTSENVNNANNGNRVENDNNLSSVSSNSLNISRNSDVSNKTLRNQKVNVEDSVSSSAHSNVNSTVSFDSSSMMSQNVVKAALKYIPYLVALAKTKEAYTFIKKDRAFDLPHTSYRDLTMLPQLDEVKMFTSLLCGVFNVDMPSEDAIMSNYNQKLPNIVVANKYLDRILDDLYDCHEAQKNGTYKLNMSELNFVNRMLISAISNADDNSASIRPEDQKTAKKLFGERIASNLVNTSNDDGDAKTMLRKITNNEVKATV